MPMRLTNDVRVEKVGGEFVALDRSGALVHRVTGDAAVALGLVIDGADVPDQYDDALATLVDAGVVESHGMTRRHLLLAAGAAGAGITTFALAAPSAAASSGCPGTFKPTSGVYTYEGGAKGRFTFNTGKGATLLTFEGWGGGGGGGGAKSSAPGGGGGGGAYAKVTVSSTYVAECTTYTIEVTADGAGGSGGKADGDGSDANEMKASLQDSKGTDVVKDAIKAKGGKKGLKSGGAGGAGGTGSSAAGTATLVRTNDGGGGAKAPDTSKGGGGGGGAGDGASATGGAASGATGGSGGVSGGGAGGAGGASATNGSAGSAPGGGGGGGGAGTGVTGGAGAAGRLKIYWS